MRVPGGRCGALLACLAVVLSVSEANFLSKQHASQVLVRKRRANSLFEETKKGNLERECIEELCSKEEAREVFENNPETEYFYPKYLGCLSSFRIGLFSPARQSTDASPDLRSCVNAIPDQCNPLPCNEDGYRICKDGQASFTCICKSGWRGNKCEFDINECENPSNINGACSQICVNTLGSYQCSCKSGYIMLSNKKDCKDVDECSVMPDICGTAVCKNLPGDFECECPEGYTYNPSSKSCKDVDECSEHMCAQLCVNYPGGYSCYCDGKKGFKLSQDQKSCEVVPVCLPLNLDKNYELLYLAEQFVGVVLFLKFRLPDVTRFSAKFDFRTYDSEGVILYAESLDHSAWFLIALRDGKIEIQFKNEYTTQITTGGKVINNGLWNMVSVEELEQSISVKIAKEAVMNINKPQSIFKPTNGFLETKVYFAALPRKMENALIRPINPRLDGCIRGWNLMNQGASGVEEIIQEKQNKHCFVSVEKGSYYPGSGVAQFSIDYNNISNPEAWQVNVTLNIRPSMGTGVIFALISNDTVPFALSLVDSASEKLQDILVSVQSTVLSRIEAVNLCPGEQYHMEFRVNRKYLELSTPLRKDSIYSEDHQRQFAILDKAMEGTVVTYLGGLPDVPFSATPVNAFFNGCMEVNVNGVDLDLDEAVSKHNDIRAHSCPSVLKNNMNT
ncbi:protein S [Rhinolophus ferrumequinum]|uniref:Vitamin K-dependent protein S n=1 Tax=Rhinolophus ferrumequinum TaxID=59479 RepID=A0A671E2M6_RHIFE|nr:vitamin K-dependent protein S [Rhinolophus ferrumequinum]KAF6385383.1 protein S [Rhinolophus ferrumequinum]